MYINLFEITGIPEFYSKGAAGLGEFYYLDNTLAYFPYPLGTNKLPFPTDEAGNFVAITAKGFMHSEEYDEVIRCYDCEEEFSKQLSLTFLSVTSFSKYEPSVYLGEEKPLAAGNGTVAGDVQSVRIIEGKERDFHMARIAIKDPTAPLGFSYLTISSLHPYTVGKGDRLCSRGRLVTKQKGLNAICPNCSCVNTIVSDSTVLQASSVQSLNSDRAYFGDFDKK